MNLQEYVPRPPITQAAVFDGSADTALSEWCSGTLIPTDDPEVWGLDIEAWGTIYHAQPGDVVYRTQNGTVSDWTPFAVAPPLLFEMMFMTRTEPAEMEA